MHTEAGPAWMQYVIPVAVIAVVMALRWRRMSRARPLKIETLWVVPAIYLVIVGFVFVQAPPAAMGWLWSALALIVGVGAGWYRGRTMRITVDPETHTLNQKASPAAFLFLIVLVVARRAAREELGGGNPSSPAAPARHRHRHGLRARPVRRKPAGDGVAGKAAAARELGQYLPLNSVVIARSVATRQSRDAAFEALDCFATLAMTMAGITPPAWRPANRSPRRRCRARN